MSTLPQGSLADRIGYQVDVNAILLKKSDRGVPLLSQDELRDMEEAYEAGDTAEEFARTILQRDNHAQARAANMNADDAPSDTHYREAMTFAGREHLLRGAF